MSDKKHIDRLFQEKLKDFEATPNDAVWESIKNKLHQKKRKRRVIPLWWQMAGIAAILALLFTVGNLVFNDNSENNTTKNPVVNTDDKDNSSGSSSETNTISNDTKEERVVLDDTVKGNSPSGASPNTIGNQAENNPTTLANTKTNFNKGKDAQKTNTITNQALTNSKNKVTMASNTKADDAINSSNLPEPNRNKIDNGQKKSETDVLIGPPKNDTKTSVADLQGEEEILKLNEQHSKKESQSIEEAIAQVNNTDEKEEGEKLSRWNISTNVAPVYFNSLGNGSSLDDQFIDNSKSGEINMSYGINGSYAINEKLKIRTGINKVNLGYNTNDVIVSQGAGLTLVGSFSRSNSNIKFNAKSQNTSILSSQNLSFSSAPEIVVSSVNATLNQEFGFIEVPIELEYAVLNKKFGLNVIGGFSTFFLDNNKVYTTLNGDKALLGEAKNINDTSYSANFGLGLNYNVSEKIKFNLEPTFKYQFNTFRDTSGDFQPYFIGIYTGLSYKF
jgi:hypothetical protein